MSKGLLPNIGWILAAAVLGLAISTVFSGWLRLPRRTFLLVYIVLAAPFLYAFFRWSDNNIGNLLRHNWAWGLLLAVLVGAFQVRNVLSQSASPTSQGPQLAFDILWLGVVYGALDAVLLSVLPVLGTFQGFSGFAWAHDIPGKILVGIVAILLSLAVTVAYHIGYPEYRVAGAIAGPSIGNGMCSLGYVLSNSPLAAILSHISMHITGVLHGPASVVQLPPHY